MNLTIPCSHERIIVKLFREELYGSFTVGFGGDEDIGNCDIGTMLVEESSDGPSVVQTRMRNERLCLRRKNAAAGLCTTHL